jgi:hypothetical protein
MATILGIGVGQMRGNTVNVTDDGVGDIQAKWNGGRVNSFAGIKTTVIEARRAARDQITFNLTGNRTTGTAVAVGSQVTTDAASAGDGGHPLNVRIRRTSGTAVQTGSILTVTVDKPTTSIVAISNDGGGAVDVDVVDTRNARNDLVALDDPTS